MRKIAAGFAASFIGSQRSTGYSMAQACAKVLLKNQLKPPMEMLHGKCRAI
jgi:hypothetical protein